MEIEELKTLLAISDRRIGNISSRFVRKIYNKIEWSARLILLKGCRGVGKTFMILQHLKKSDKKSVYLSLDHLFFLTSSLFEVIDTLYKDGVRLIALDEIHKYPNWSIELKNIYDSYPDLALIVTSSSALDIKKGSGDLSRRLDIYEMNGLSFLEYLDYEYDIDLPGFSFEELLSRYEEIFDKYYETLNLGVKFKSYIKHGYYPFYKESKRKYHDRLLAVIMQVIDSDMVAIFNIDYESTRQIKKLLALISRIGPFTPNISKLSRDLKMSRNSVLTYLDYLAEAGIINILKSANKSDSSLTKPDKVFLENSNLLYAFETDEVNKGTIRETFVYNSLKLADHKLTTPAKGDFLLDNSFVIEVGGPNKDFKQIREMPNPVLIKDGIEKGGPNFLPLWMLGLLE